MTYRIDNLRHRSFRLALALGMLLGALSGMPGTPAHAGGDVNVSAGLTAAGAPLAIHGYDPVAFFTDGEAKRGSARFTAKHDGAAYRFVSEANKLAFERDPGRYLPQFGGFCAYGVSVGAKFDGDPRLFAVVDDKLYFNLNPEIQATWEVDVAGNIRKAEKQWPEVRKQ